MSTFRDTNVSTADETTRANALCEAMVRGLREPGWIRSDRVADAFFTVPRHLFAPGTPLETAYAPHDSVVINSDEQGKATSVVSAPYIQAMMVEQAGISPGMRVLEIGSGGYNAALIAELVGVTGEVTTVDIDPSIELEAGEISGSTAMDVDGEDVVWAAAPAVSKAGLMIVSDSRPGGIDLRIDADGGWCGEAGGRREQAPGLPATLPEGAVEARRARGPGWARAIACDATSALDLRGTARRPRASPRPTAHQLLHPPAAIPHAIHPHPWQ